MRIKRIAAAVLFVRKNHCRAAFLEAGLSVDME